MRTFALSSYSRYRTELMGIAIIGVSLLHAMAWAEVDGTLVAKLLEPFARIAFTEGFLFLSGFGLVYSFSKDGNCKRFYLKRVKRLWLPFVLMALPFYLYGLCSGSFTLPRVLAKLTTAYFWIWGNDGMWYISMSVALYLLFPVAYRYMIEGKNEKAALCNTIHIVISCYVVLGALYCFCTDYYNLLQIGITKAPIFFIGMLAAHLAKCNKCLSIKWLVGGGRSAHNTLFSKALVSILDSNLRDGISSACYACRLYSHDEDKFQMS